MASLQLFRHGEAIPLTPKVFDTLLVLLRHRERVVTKDDLMRMVWGDVIVTEDSVIQSISALRRALGDDPNQAEYVSTVPRRGYRFVAPVAEIGRDEATDSFDAAVAGTSDEARPSPVVSPQVHSRGSAAVMVAAPRRRRRLWTTALMSVAVAAGVLIGARLSPTRRASPAGPLRFTIQAPMDSTIESSGILSPDSRRMVFAAQDETGRTALWVRELDGSDARLVPGTDGAARPFWSPDGQSIGFFADSALKKVTLGGDPPQTLARVGLSAGGGSWGSSGVIVYSKWRSGLFSVPADGGTPTPVTTLDAGANEAWHLTPQFLPDGRHFLFNAATGDPPRAATYVASLDSQERVRLLDIGGAVFAPPSHLMYVRERTLMVQSFDPDRLRVSGQPHTLFGNVPPPDRAGVISATSGLLSFGGGIGDSHFVWLDRAGRPLRTVDAPVPLHQPAFGRDQKQLLASGGSGGGRGIWTVDLERTASARLTDGGTTPTISPDATRLAFTSDRRGGVFNIFLRTIGHNDDELVLQNAENKIVYDWSPDGRYIVFGTTNEQTNKDLWILPMEGDRQPQPFLVTPFNEIQAQVSPDNRRVAYASDESGRWEVYVQSFPIPGNKQIVSVGEGAQPQWRRDGRELYYLSATHRLMAVAMDASGGRIGAPQELFRAPVWGDLSTYRSQYLVASDGQRFLVDALQAVNSRDPITVVVNWTELLNP